MTRAWWVAAVCLGFGVVPAAAQQTGSVGIQRGLSASGPALAGTANLLAEFGSFSIELLPKNISAAGFFLSWEPFDWGG